MNKKIKHLEFKLNNLTNKYEELKRRVAIKCVEERLFVINKVKKIGDTEILLERNPQQVKNNFLKGIEYSVGRRRKKAIEIVELRRKMMNK